MKIRNPQNRQGITLLFVISIIVLFLLMGTAFVVVSNNFYRQSRNTALANIPEGRGPEQGIQLVEEAFLQLVRGPELTDIESPLRVNDILGDQYGFGFKAFVAATPARVLSPDNVLVEFRVSAIDSESATPTGAAGNQAISMLEFNAAGAPMVQQLFEYDDGYGGQVLSVTSGPLKGFSTRIVSDRVIPDGEMPPNFTHFFTIPSQSITGDRIVNLAQLAGAEIIVNGRDFGGTGPAFTTAGGNPRLGGEALLPNRRNEPLNSMTMNYLSATADGSAGVPQTTPNTLSTNEPWDAPDFGTMFLSGYDENGGLIPSFHRNSLADFVANDSRVSNGREAKAFFHAFDIDGDNLPDVDVTGDGVEDAFWIDPGFSIVTNAQGQRFKPLVAYHVVDLDGRLNVNAHGNLTQVRQTGPNMFVQDSFINRQKAPIGPQPMTPPGQGWGPPAVDLSPAFQNSSGVDQLGVTRRLMEQRYGDDEVPGVLMTAFNSPRSRAQLFGHPVSPVDPASGDFGTVGRLFGGSPMDLHDRFRIRTPANSSSQYAMGVPITTTTPDNFSDRNLDAGFSNGMPEINMLTSRFTGPEFTNSPYEFSLGGDSAGDAPYVAAELERLLRPNDFDAAGLPDRLWRLPAEINPNADLNNFWVNDTDGIVRRNQLFTTDSFEVPLLPQNIVSVIRRTLRQQNTGIDDPDLLRLTDVLRNAFAPELFAGLKMDINRPFGDGNDNNDGTSNGVVDEPGEAQSAINTDAREVLGTATGPRRMDLNNNGIVNNGIVGDPSEEDARIIFARQLYVLAMLLMEIPDMDEDGTVDRTFDIDPTTAPTDRELFAQSIAQWAINVVDFRDPDSINTRFIYDPDPFNVAEPNVGFDPPTTDGAGLAANGNNARFVVWGCERPELLLTETLAGHIQNTEDDGSGGMEQRVRPEGFAFFEVYNPWTQNSLNQRLDPSLYDTGLQGVQLGRLSEAGGTAASPIWRFEVERIETTGEATPLRYVYMADPTAANITYNDSDPNGANQTQADIEVFYPSTTTNAIVRPGAQATIGTRGVDRGSNTFAVFMGRRTDATEDPTGVNDMLNLDTTMRIELDAGSNVIRRYNAANAPIETRQSQIVLIDQFTDAMGMAPADPMLVNRRFSLSDPHGGYMTTDNSGVSAMVNTGDDQRTVYSDPHPTPLDMMAEPGNRNHNMVDIPAIRTPDGLTPNFRTVRLQRLANPLLRWNVVTNPYLTIDSMEVDLASFNGIGPSDGSLTPVPAHEDGRIVSHERGSDQNDQKTLWGLQRSNTVRNPVTTTAATAAHHLSIPFDETLGKTNDTLSTAATMAFPWLTWNNRPFVSGVEIMNVPFLPSDRLTYAPEGQPVDLFTIDDGMTMPHLARRTPRGLSGRYGHLLNFFGDDELAGTTNQFASAHRLLEFIDVPSRFVGTSTIFTPGPTAFHPFNGLSRYRVPGKINLNTIPPTLGRTGQGTGASLIWDTLQGGFQGGGGLNWPEFVDSVYRSTMDSPTDVHNPIRPSLAANFMPSEFIPASVAPAASVGATMLRPDRMDNPLFDYDSNDQADNSLRSAYFRNSMRMRLDNLTTNRSSVFAVWVTVGYFEVDQNGDLVDVNGMTLDTDNDPMTPVIEPLTPSRTEIAEIGAEDGTATRNRGFFIFDRSIPVAYEPGKNHNVDDAVILKSIIE